ncbi:MAG: hypothetical protein EHM80_06170, partial [Nitrospiraceae bacterium]
GHGATTQRYRREDVLRLSPWRKTEGFEGRRGISRRTSSRYSPYAHAIWVRTRLRRNNTSGIPGVDRYEERVNPHTGHTRVFWLASWVNEQGDSRKRKFAVSHYGERHAKRLAVAERERQLTLVCAIKSADL